MRRSFIHISLAFLLFSSVTFSPKVEAAGFFNDIKKILQALFKGGHSGDYNNGSTAGPDDMGQSPTCDHCSNGDGADDPRATDSYKSNTSGFYLNHYAKVGDIPNKSCKQFGDKVYRGGEPKFDGTDDWLKKLKASNVKTVFDLRAENSSAKKLERDMLLKNGIGYVNLPLKTKGSSQDEYTTIEIGTPGGNPEVTTKGPMKTADATKYALELMNKEIDESSSKGSIYLHCQRGEDRTGTMIKLLRQCPYSNTALSEFRNFGGANYAPLTKLVNDVTSSK